MIEFTDSADKHGVPHDEAVWAASHPESVVPTRSRRPGYTSFIIVGPAHAQTERKIEVGVASNGQGHLVIFHALPK